MFCTTVTKDLAETTLWKEKKFVLDHDLKGIFKSLMWGRQGIVTSAGGNGSSRQWLVHMAVDDKRRRINQNQGGHNLQVPTPSDLSSQGPAS